MKHKIVFNEWYDDKRGRWVEVIVDDEPLNVDGINTFNCISDILAVLGIEAEIQFNVKIEKREMQTIRQRLVRD